MGIIPSLSRISIHGIGGILVNRGKTTPAIFLGHRYCREYHSRCWTSGWTWLGNVGGWSRAETVLSLQEIGESVRSKGDRGVRVLFPRAKPQMVTLARLTTAGLSGS